MLEEIAINDQDIVQHTAEPILVTGATGNVGREIVKSLHALGYAVQATALNEQDAANVPTEADEIVLFEFGKLDTYTAAFTGVKKLFLMRPPAISDVETYIKPVINFAAGCGVDQIAFLSLIGRKKNGIKRHHANCSGVRNAASYSFM